MERARTEWLRHLGVEQDRLIDEHGIIFAVRSLLVDYLAPARFNDALQVSVEPDGHGRASLEFIQQIRRDGTDAGQLLCQGRVKIACLDAASLRPRRIPSAVYVEIMRDH